MKIIYSNHAKKRIKQRGIEDWEVGYLLKHPKYIKKSYGGTKEAIGEVKGRKLKIIFKELENYIKIITVRYL